MNRYEENRIEQSGAGVTLYGQEISLLMLDVTRYSSSIPQEHYALGRLVMQLT